MAVTGAIRQRAIDIVLELKKWWAGLPFTEEKVVSLQSLLAGLESLDVMIGIPVFLQPLGIKVRIHDEVYIVVGISRKSSRPGASDTQAQTAEYYEREGQYVRFYMSRCHYIGECEECCQTHMERVVIFGCSTTNFENSKANDIQDLRMLLNRASEYQKVVVVCTQVDGLCSSMIGLTGFLEPFLERHIQLELIV